MATPTPALEPLLKIGDVARLLSCSRASVYALIARGELATIDIGTGGQRSRLRVRPSDIDRFINGRETS